MVRILVLAALLSTTGLVVPAKAQSPAFSTTQAQTTRDQVANACIQNQADTLPVPFNDVSPNYWAFKAVMTMHYCGAFRARRTTGSVSSEANAEPAAKPRRISANIT